VRLAIGGRPFTIIGTDGGLIDAPVTVSEVLLTPGDRVEEPHHRDKPVKVGELQVWDVINDTLMDHPFHLHGFFFQVLEVNGEPPAFRSWEDTVNVPPKSRVRIAFVPDDRPGEWMYHCHILEHHASGMMAHFAVVP
jgi:FtsP/CotA-like multicopper oxidase with cupredoxin domain